MFSTSSGNTHFVKAEIIEDFQYYLLTSATHDQKAEDISLQLYKYKLHLNFNEESLVKKRAVIIDAILKAARIAKIGAAIPSFKYFMGDPELIMQLEKAEFFSWILSLPNNKAFVPAVREGMSERKSCAVYEDDIELAIKQNGNNGLMQFAKQSYSHLIYAIEHTQRYINRGQFTLYLLDVRNTADLAAKIVKFIEILESKLNDLAVVCSEGMNATDSPLTKFFSFRQERFADFKDVERFQIDQDLHFVYQPSDVEKIRKEQSSSDLYKLLVKELQKLNLFCNKPIVKFVAGSYCDEFLKTEIDDERRFNEFRNQDRQAFNCSLRRKR